MREKERTDRRASSSKVATFRDVLKDKKDDEGRTISIARTLSDTFSLPDRYPLCVYTVYIFLFFSLS